MKLHYYHHHHHLLLRSFLFFCSLFCVYCVRPSVCLSVCLPACLLVCLSLSLSRLSHIVKSSTYVSVYFSDDVIIFPSDQKQNEATLLRVRLAQKRTGQNWQLEVLIDYVIDSLFDCSGDVWIYWSIFFCLCVCLALSLSLSPFSFSFSLSPLSRLSLSPLYLFLCLSLT